MNRLPMYIIAGALALGFALFYQPVLVNAQFNFAYPGPHVLAVGPTCSSPLSPQLGTPIVTSTGGGIITVSEIDSVASGFGLYVETFTTGESPLIHWHVEDNLGNSQNFLFSVTFADQTGPVFDLFGIPSSMVFNSIVQVPPPPVIPVTDNCTPINQIDTILVQTTPPPICSSGIFTRTWTATDLVGNSSQFTQTITIFADTLVPQVFVSPVNGSAACETLSTAYPAWLATQMANFYAVDPSTPIVYSNNAPPSFPSGCAMPITVVFSATDACNHTTTRSAVFTTSDNNPPVIDRSPTDSLAACSYSGNQLASLADWIHRRAGMNYHDACSTKPEQTISMTVGGLPADSAQIVAAFLASYANGCSTQPIGSTTYDKVRGKVTVNYFVTDPCNNTTNAGAATFGAIDTLPPNITGNALVLEECGSGDDQQKLQDWINNHGGASFADDCSGANWTNFSWTTSTGTTGTGNFNSGPYPQIQANNCAWYVDVAYRATDECGNIGSATLRFQIRDLTNPVLSGFQPVDTIYCPQPFPTVFPGIASDNCDAVVAITHAYHFSDTTCVGNYKLTVTWLATDDCGNTVSAVQTYYVRDTIGPEFVLVPSDINAGCDNYTSLVLPVPGVDVKASDICGAMDAISIGQTSTQSLNPGVCGHYNFTITRIFTARDVCGNTTTATQAVHVSDNTGPVLSGFLDTMLVCEVQPITPAPTALDNCSGIAVAPFTTDTIITAGPCADAYIMTLKWQASDVCGNTGTFSQDVMVQDTMRPSLQGIPGNITVECNNIPAPPALVSITGLDNCDESVSVTFSETEIRDPNLANCAHWSNYMIRREWTGTDNCGNSRTYTQWIHVEDTTGPEIVMPAPVLLPSDPGICGANVVPPAPLSIYDDCTAQGNTIALYDTALLLTASGGVSFTEPADTIVFSWSSPITPPLTPAVDSAMLTISLRNADAESTAEFAWVYGEDGLLLGKTAATNIQCGNSDTTFKIGPDLLNAWLTDGTLDITLVPSAGLNPWCPAGGKALAALSFPVANPQVPLTVTFRIDNGPVKTFPTVNDELLSVGMHTIVYTATDCAGNSSTAAVSVQVDDVEPPYLSSTPPATAYVDADGCQVDVLLPFPGIIENCGLAGTFLGNSAIAPVKFEDDDDAGKVPKEQTLVITNAIPNAVTGGVLRIKHKGDNAQAALGEFYNVYGEDSNTIPIGTTFTGTPAVECSQFRVTTISLSAAQINNWSADNLIRIKLKSNRDLLNFTDFINNCSTVNPVDSTDGVSVVQIEVEYDYAVVDYEVKKSPNGPLLYNGQLFGNQTTVNLSPGNYTVHYSVQDAAGISGTTNYPLMVRDTIKPTAQCSNITIFVNASGELNYQVTPAQINNNSVDNCSGTNLSYQLNPSVFTCSQAGGFYPVTLTVTDTSGNSSACQSLVRVETASFTPSYIQICLGDTLFLFTNPPPTPGGDGIFTYKWTYPNGNTSTAQNPVIPNTTTIYEGQYSVTITGLTGCTASGMVTVDLIDLPNQPTVVANNICAGEDLFLTATPEFNGSGVMYEWYSGTIVSPTLVATTLVPSLTIVQPPAGQYQYFVKIKGNGCISQPSAVTTVNVFALPVASIQQGPSVQLCECDARVLGTSVQGPPATSYNWNGPGFFSNQQFPPVKACVALSDSGLYSLVVTQNGCASLPATTFIHITPKPATPQITGNSQVCEGATVQLTVNNVPADFYVWSDPNNLVYDTTYTNTLILPSATLAQAGNWRVYASRQGCRSDLSAAFNLKVQAYPQVVAEANSPLCDGEDLQLTASANADSLSYHWTHLNSGYTSFLQNPMPPPDSGYYVVVASTSFGCSDTDSVYVTFSPVPVIQSITNNAPICADGNVNVSLFTVINTATPIVTYQWIVPPATGPLDGPNPVILSAGSANNGIYLLTVFDSLGCRSLPEFTVVDIHDIPATPNIAPLSPVCVGGTVTIHLTNPDSYQNGAYEFSWTLPNGSTQITTQPVYTVTNAQFSDAGFYKVTVSSDTCTSLSSVSVNLVVNAIPFPPVLTITPNPVCQGSTLNLSVPSVSGASYEWITPPSIPTLPNASSVNIDNVAQLHEGYYFCKITVNGCTSDAGEGYFVDVLPLPATPVIYQPVTPVCFDQATDTLFVYLLAGSTTQNATYTWYNELNQVLAGPSQATFFKTTDYSKLHPGSNGIYVVASLNGCTVPASATATVTLDTIPEGIIAYAGDNRPVCAQAQSFMLNATPPAAGSGKWTPAGGPATTIANSTMPNTPVSGAVAGNIYQYAWTLSSGACENFSADTVTITAVAPEQAQARTKIDTCFVQSVNLHAFQGQNTFGVWSQIPGQHLLGVTIADSLDPNTAVDSLKPGQTYYFYWTLQDIGCGVSTVEVTVRIIGSDAYAGEDETVCNADSCILLMADVLPDKETGKWTAPQNPFIHIPSPTLPSTTACKLQVGDNLFVWTTNDGLCGHRSVDSVIIHYEITPFVQNDTVYVPFGTHQTIEVLPNDFLPLHYDVEVTDRPDHGSFEEEDQGIYGYQPNIGFSGLDQMLYRVCNLTCIDACNNGTVTIIVDDAEGCDIPTVITPNGDGVNDVFFVPCLSCDCVLDNELSIFNQWGDEVFHAQPYNNDWEGTYNNEHLPAGTYFFIVKFNGDGGIKKGFLVIQR